MDFVNNLNPKPNALKKPNGFSAQKSNEPSVILALGAMKALLPYWAVFARVKTKAV